ELPGYMRGLALYDRFAFVGLSKLRETATFGGMPIAERRTELKCGVGVVDLGTGRLVAHLEFMTGVEEIFDVQVVTGARCVALSGPYAGLDDAAPIWTVPQPAPPPGDREANCRRGDCPLRLQSSSTCASFPHP